MALCRSSPAHTCHMLGSLLYHSIGEVGAFDHSIDPLHDIEEEVQVDVEDIHPLAFLLAIHHLVLGLSTHLFP